MNKKLLFVVFVPVSVVNARFARLLFLHRSVIRPEYNRCYPVNSAQRRLSTHSMPTLTLPRLYMYIVADIGGTNARLELLTRDQLDGSLPPTYAQVYASQTMDSLESLIRKFVMDYGTEVSISAVFCGIPGDVTENEVDAMNLLHWGRISGGLAARTLGIPKLLLVNDFEAAAHVLNSLSGSDVIHLHEGTQTGTSVRAIVGLGTGLGVSFAVKDSSGSYRPLASEAGYIPFIELNSHDSRLAQYVRGITGSNTVAFEHVCSGPGLVNIYKYVCHEKSIECPETLSPLDICREYTVSIVARETCDILFEFLGRFLSLLALVYKPTGGIYLTGGTMDSLGPILMANLKQFLIGLACRDHPVLVDIALRPSIYLIKKANVGLWGARELAISHLHGGH